MHLFGDRSKAGEVQCKFSTLKSIKAVSVAVVKAATLNLTVEALENVVGLLYS